MNLNEIHKKVTEPCSILKINERSSALNNSTLLQSTRQLSCLSFFDLGEYSKLGIRNSSAQPMIAVVSWQGLGVYRYQVNGHSEIIIMQPVSEGRLIGEDPFQDTIILSKLPVEIISESGETKPSNSIMPTAIANSSVDSSTNDDGALLWIYNAYQTFHNMKSVKLHSSTAQAFANIRSEIADFNIIVGHGDQGTIITGSGLATDGVDKHMALSNESNWIPCASPGIPGHRLVLFSCKVAGGVPGATFLQRLANVIRKEVGGWTGDCHCGGGGGKPAIWGTGEFLIAKPGGHLKPVNSPEMYHGNKKMQFLRFKTADGHQDVQIDWIKSVNFTPVGSLPEMHKAINLRGHAVSTLLELIDFENPLTFDDKPLSMLVGQLTISFDFKEEERSRTFRVLGYSLLQDACFRNTYYYTSSKLRNLLQGTT